MGGVALMSAFVLFTFLAAPSTLLLRSINSPSPSTQTKLALPSWISRRFASPSAPPPSPVPAITWTPQMASHSTPLPSRVLEEVLLHETADSSVRHLAPPVVPVVASTVAAPSRSTAVAPYASRALLAVQVSYAMRCGPCTDNSLAEIQQLS
jgi:hypothetical protein